MSVICSWENFFEKVFLNFLGHISINLSPISIKLKTNDFNSPFFKSSVILLRNAFFTLIAKPDNIFSYPFSKLSYTC